MTQSEPKNFTDRKYVLLRSQNQRIPTDRYYVYLRSQNHSNTNHFQEKLVAMLNL